jgi:hypothetical protein
MIVIRNKRTKLAIYLFDDSEFGELSETLVLKSGKKVSDIRAETHEAVEAPEPPMQWMGGQLLFDGNWSVAYPDSYAELIAEQDQQKTMMLDAIREQLSHRVSEEAEKQRLKYVTPGSAKAMVYSQKHDEARRFAADPDPAPESYPLLSAEVGITAEDLAGVAQVVIATANTWLKIAAAIEHKEKQARLAIAQAPDDIVSIETAAKVDWRIEQ